MLLLLPGLCPKAGHARMLGARPQAGYLPPLKTTLLPWAGHTWPSSLALCSVVPSAWDALPLSLPGNISSL